MAKTKNRGPVEFSMVDASEVPRRMTAISLQWKKLLTEVIETGRRAKLVNLGGRTSRGVMSSIVCFVNRYPEITAGYRVRTQNGPDGEVYVWAEKLPPDAPGDEVPPSVA